MNIEIKCFQCFNADFNVSINADFNVFFYKYCQYFQIGENCPV